MFSRQATRGTVAALMVALVAVLLMAFGGPDQVPAQETYVAGTSHTGSAAKVALAPQAVTSSRQHQVSPYLDLASTPPAATAGVRPMGASGTHEIVLDRTDSNVVTPTGRAPPAL